MAATIQGIYVALFGRPADPAGLAYFNGVTNNGADLTAIGDLAATKEYTDRFAGQSNLQIITSIYQSLFDRNPDSGGLEFFTNALTTGAININNIAINILDGAKGDDLTLVNKKIAAADLYTAAIDTGTEAAAYSGTAAADLGRAFIDGVTATSTAVDAAAANTAVQELLTAGATGNTITLTAAQDSTVSLTEATQADAMSTDKNDTINASAAADTLEATDSIDGGLGTDTVNAEIDGSGLDTTATTLVGIEQLNITTSGAAATVDIEDTVGLEQVTNVDGATALTVNGAAAGVALGVKGTAGAATSFALADATGSSDAVTIALDGATAASAVTVADVETINLTNTGTSDVDVLTIAAATALNITGDGSLDVITPSTALTSIDASAYTGALTMTTVGQLGLTSFKGGTGVDTITTDSLGTADTTVDLGAGADVLTIAASTAATKALTVTLGDGGDIVNIQVAGNVDAFTSDAELEASLITITDFSTTSDLLNLTAGAGVQQETFTNPTQTILADANSTLLAKLTAVAGEVGVNDFAFFIHGSDTYYYNNEAVAGVSVADTLVKLTGVTTALDATDFVIV